MLNTLYSALPGLQAALDDHPLSSEQAVWPMLERLLQAHAPSGGAGLPGAIGETIAALASELGLRDRFIPRIGSTGNAGLWLGGDKAQADLVIVAHMDRPTFKVRAHDQGALYAICANRFPDGHYEVPAKALCFDEGRIAVSARGLLLSDRDEAGDRLRFQATSGILSWRDLIVMDTEPTLDGDLIRGTGLDNSLGVITMLGAAAALRGIEAALIEHDRRLLFVFTDQEEGIPEGFFGHGAARLAYALPPPAIGAIVVDTQSTGDETDILLGRGAGHGSVASWGRGAVAPPNALALAADLADAVNAAYPETVQMNTGYLSRSDDVALSRWTQVLGMIGPPMRDAHTGHESAALADIPRAIRWLAYFIAATSGVSPAVAAAYRLG